ncbi:hypothetical protein Tco_0299118 [Tanacetum coccineum]
MDIEADDEEDEEEHLAPADSVVVALLATDQAPSAVETEPFETDESTATPPPHPAYLVTARISIPAPVLTHCIALGPGYEVGESSSTAAARITGGLRADYGFVATMDREIRRDPEREVGYGITDSWDEIVETLQGAPVSTDTELGVETVLAGGSNMLFRDKYEAHGIYKSSDGDRAQIVPRGWRRFDGWSDLLPRRGYCHCALPYWVRCEIRRSCLLADAGDRLDFGDLKAPMEICSTQFQISGMRGVEDS